MTIDFYAMSISPPCRAVLMTARHLGIDLNVKNVDLSIGQQMDKDFLKKNPVHSIPLIDDNGFCLWESRAIMRYLCNQYAPDSPLYPKDVKKRAIVDRLLDFDLCIFKLLRESLIIPKFSGLEAKPHFMASFTQYMQDLDAMIATNHYLTGDELTIADLSMLATTYSFTIRLMDFDFAKYKNYNRWLTGLSKDLPYFAEFNGLEERDVKEFMSKMNAMFNKRAQANLPLPTQ